MPADSPILLDNPGENGYQPPRMNGRFVMEAMVTVTTTVSRQGPAI